MATATKQPASLSIEEMMSYLNEDKYVVLDIETTGLSPAKGGYLLEVAAVKVEKGKITGEFESLIDPGVKFYKKTIELTGITNEMVQGMPTYGEVLPDLFDFIGDAVVVAHNAQFDWNRFLLHYFGKLGYYPTNPAICTKRIFQKLYPERLKTKEGYGLSSLVTFYGVPFNEDEHHRALVDTIGTAKAFIKMREDALKQKPSTNVNVIFTKKKVQKREKDKVTDVKIQSARYWEKTFGTRTIKRIYVQIEDAMKQFGTVYYDIQSRKWYIKEYHSPIDLNHVEKLVLEHLKVDTLEDYLNGLRRG